MPVLLLLGVNHRLPLLHMSIHFICLNQTKKLIIEFAIVYMINPGLNINKDFRDRVGKCIYTKLGGITQPFIKVTFSKKNTCLLALIMFYDTRADIRKKYFRFLMCVF